MRRAFRSIAHILVWAMSLTISAAYADGRFERGSGAGNGIDHKPVLLVFIHGVTGGESTWKNVNGAFWPSLVKNDTTFDNADIFVYDYPSPYVAKSYSVGGLAERLLTDLKDPSISALNYDSIVIVAHSLGGVIARQMVLAAPPEIRQNIKALFLFGSPLGGSSYSNFVKYTSRNVQFLQLEKSEDPDRISNRIVKDWINQQIKVPSFCAYELSEPVIVTRADALPLCSHSLRELDRSHIGLIKPESADSDPHRLLREWYGSLFPEAANPTIAEEENKKIVVASCSGDKNYKEGISRDLAKQLNGINGYGARASALLPSDWTIKYYKSLLWRKFEPAVIVIHFSCFERDLKNNDNIADRDADFGEFLDTLKDDNVKLIIYSRVFKGYPDHLDKIMKLRNIERKFRDRLILMPVAESKLLGKSSEANGQLKDYVFSLVK